MIGHEDVALFTIVDTVERAVAVLHDFYHGVPPE